MGSPIGKCSKEEWIATAITGAEWFLGAFALSFAAGLQQNPRPSWASLFETAASAGLVVFCGHIARIFGTNTISGNGPAK